MASGSKSLVKGVLVLLFIAAVFTGLSFLLEEAPQQAPIAITPSSRDGEYGNDPAVLEARETGAEIGARIGEEVGRRVGELLVASLDDISTQTGEDDATISEPVMTADAGGDTEADEEPAPEMTEDEAVAVESAAADMPEAPEDSMGTPSEADDTAMTTAAEQSESGDASEDATDSPAYTIADEPAIPAPEKAMQVEAEPDPSKNFTFASSGWWNDSANGKGLRIVHIGQAANASGITRSIVVILSAPIQGMANLEQLIQVRKADGTSVSGTWRRSANARNLYMHVDESGTYQLSFASAVASRDGLTLGMDLSGPVTIR